MSKGIAQSDDGSERVFLNRIQNSPTASSFPKSTSDLFPRRLSVSQDAQPMNRGMKLTKNQPPPLESRSTFKLNGNGREPASPTLSDHPSNFGRDRYVSHYISHDAARPATADGNMNGRSKLRGSLLVAASDALSFKFGRRRPSIRQPPMSIILPDVIEIRAPRPDEEDEERNRLREMAAQAIGLGPYMVSGETQSREDSATDEDEEDRRHIHDSAEHRRLSHVRNLESAPTPTPGRKSPHGSSVSVTIPIHHPQPTRVGRYRAGSVPTGHSPSNSMTIAPIPPFPSTVASLTSFQQCAGPYPKYYPPSSLRIFALSKNWKSRYLILSSPATLVTRNQSPAVSYLHLFKSSSTEDKELERLEINEDSVVFVAEEEVGGRRHVIKVGGVDVGAMKKEYTHEEGGHIMWLLQISDPADAQTWITNIKNAILGQRTVRAGLIPALSPGNNEPRGDMDVMLSIRAQGAHSLITSPTSSTFRPSQNSSPVPFTQMDTNPTYASSISSHSVRSQSTVPKPSSSGAVSALKGLFSTSGRPRSASRAASLESERQQERGEGNEDSFTSMGSNLLSMMRSNTPDTQSINTVNTVHTSPIMRTNLPFSGPVNPADRRIDRKIIPKPQSVQWSTIEPTPSSSRDRVNRGFSLGALSLQPPPRKRWNSSEPTGSSTQSVHTQEPLMAESPRRVSFSASLASAEPTDPEPQLAGFSFGTPEQRPRAPSIQSISTLASGENGISAGRSSSSTKRSSGTRSARRWSRQGIIPNRSNPPTDPPPAIPHPYAAEQLSSRGSSQSSRKSIVSALPSFSKRQSGSSVKSFNSLSTTHSPPPSISSNIHPPTTSRSTSNRISMPPRPAPTSALPPAPGEATQDSQDVFKPLEPVAGPSKSSFRNSVHRPFRLSMTAPKPPPSTTLPPRPDEPEYKNHHRRSSSGSNNLTHSTKLETIPASPVPPPKVVNPFPPPAGPLPPTPPIPPPIFSAQSAGPAKRSTSLKQRLRILSTPSPSGNQFQGKLQLSRPSTSGIMTSSSFMTASPPPTPIAEKIMLFQNDPSFLQMHTPVIPSIPPPTAIISTPSRDDIADFTELPPPPRRGSKQLLESELPKNILTHALSDARVPTPDIHTAPRHLSLSRPGSAMSNRSDRTESALETDWDSPKDEIAPAREELPAEKPHSPTLEPPHLSLSRPGSVVSLGIVTM